MENETIKNVMVSAFGSFLEKYSSSTYILLLCFASIIYYLSYLLSIIDNNPGYVLNNIHILYEKDMLDNLNKFITADPSSLITATDVPPHTCQL